MKRDIIIIEDKAVSVTGNEVWMTATEIAGLFHTTVPAVNAAIKATCTRLKSSSRSLSG